MVKKFFSILLWILTAAGVIAVFWFARYSYLHSSLKEVVLKFDRYDSSKGFVDYNKEYQHILNMCDTTVNHEINQISLDTIVDSFKKNPWVKKASASITLDRILRVKVHEHQPVMRIYNVKNESVYITAEGLVLPVNKNYAPRVPLVNGYLNFKVYSDTAISVSDSLYRNTELYDAYCLMYAVHNDELLNVLVEQAYFGKNKEIELVPSNNSFTVSMGNMDNLNDKLLRLNIFLKQKIGTPELRKYKKINLKYNNQVVCIKNN